MSQARLPSRLSWTVWVKCLKRSECMVGFKHRTLGCLGWPASDWMDGMASRHDVELACGGARIRSRRGCCYEKIPVGDLANFLRLLPTRHKPTFRSRGSESVLGFDMRQT